jgi:hypothetical protein
MPHPLNTRLLPLAAAALAANHLPPHVIGGWTTASLRQSQLLNPAAAKGHQTSAKAGGAWVQVSRLGMPLVNEVVIGRPDKDRFNSGKRQDDGQFADYVTRPRCPRCRKSRRPWPTPRPPTSRGPTWSPPS